MFYYCMGSLLTLIDEFKRDCKHFKSRKDNMSIQNQDIIELLLEKPFYNPYPYNQFSSLKNCSRGLSRNFYNKDLYEQEDAFDMKKQRFIASSKNLLNSILCYENNIKTFLVSLLFVIENDTSIPTKEKIGLYKTYTKEYILSQSEWNILELLSNLLYYAFMRNNECDEGIKTVNLIKEASFIQEQIINSSKYELTEEHHEWILKKGTSTRTNESPDSLTHELSNTKVVRTIAENVLFRNEEFDEIHNEILENIKSKQTFNLVLYGKSGCGKRSLTRKLYTDLSKDYDYCGWIDYSGNLMQSIIQFKNADNKMMIDDDLQSKWEFFKDKLMNTNKSKLLVISNVNDIPGIQSPQNDKELIDIASWENMTVIITSNLSHIPGYDNYYPINNINHEKCKDLFYYYNQNAAEQHSSNDKTVEKLCQYAEYNTLMIELLAKNCVDDSLDDFYKKLKSNAENEPLAKKIYTLFFLKHREPIEQLILWDFHCLGENEKVSHEELNHWMGFEDKDINPLIKDGWIKELDGYYFIHPLISQSTTFFNKTPQYYWNKKNELKISLLISALSKDSKEQFFSKTDSFGTILRKIKFADCLTYEGSVLSPKEWLYIANFARSRGNQTIAIKYYKKTYDEYHIKFGSSPHQKLIKLNEDNKLDDQLLDNQLREYWTSAYYYGFVLSYPNVANYKDAEELLYDALEIAEKLIEKFGYTEKNIPLLASSLDRLGYIIGHSNNNDIPNDIRSITLAEICLSDAILLRQFLQNIIKSPLSIIQQIHELAWSLDTLGYFYTRINPNEVTFNTNENIKSINNLDLIRRIHEYTLNCNDLNAFYTQVKPDGVLFHTIPSLDDIHYLNKEELILHRERSEKILKDALHIREQLAICGTNHYSTEVAWTSYKLAYLLSTYDDRLLEVEQYLKQAINICQCLSFKNYSSQHKVLEATATALYAKILRKIGLRELEAVSYYKKARNLYQKLEDANPGSYTKEINELNEEI